MKKILILSLSVLLAVSCSPKDEKKELAQKMDEYFSQQYPADQPGGAVLLLKDTSVIFSKGYGLADLTTKEPITTKTLFNLDQFQKHSSPTASSCWLSREDFLWKIAC
ncbi:MAG: hypothetical protein WDN75_15525 [Bacteroidota bacterium]